MDAHAPTPQPHRRVIAWTLWSAVGVCVLVGVTLATWVLVPRLAPALVIARSPWVDPALRAVVHGGGDQNAFHDRVLFEWEIEAVPALLRTLGSRHAGERREAVLALGIPDYGTSLALQEQVISALLPMLTDQDETVQLAAIDAFLSIRPRGNADLLLMLVPLLRSTSPALREAATEALQLILEDESRSSRCLAELITLLGDGRVEVRKAVIDVLDHFNQEMLWQTIVDGLGDARPAVRWGLMDVIEDSYLIPVNNQNEGWLVPWLPMVPPLLALYTETDDAQRRIRVLRALAPIGDPRSLPVLRQALADPDQDVRRHAMIGLEVIGRNEVADIMLRRADDPDPEVAANAREILHALRLTQAISLFVAETRHPDRDRRAAALTALMDLKDQSLVFHAHPLLSDPDERIRAQAVRAYGTLTGSYEAGVLLYMLDDRAWLVRWNAARALGKFNDPRIADALLDRLAAGHFTTDPEALRRSSDPEQAAARWHNAVIDAVERQQLTIDQRGRVPVRLPPRGGTEEKASD